MHIGIGIGIGIRKFGLLLVLCCILGCSNAEHAKKEQQLKSAVVVGTVYCDTCFRQEFSKASHFISGASVAVECVDSATTASFRKEVKTNWHGVFRVRLPVKISANIDSIKACSVKLIKSSEPLCTVASYATSAGLHLKSKRNGLHVFSAGFFTFKPLNQPELCYQEPKPVGSAKSVTFANQKPAQPAMFFPPIPFLPSPGLPLPPNPLVPPPSLLPPVIPSPPPSVLPPILPSPPPSLLPPLPNFPPVPLLTPPPPPPASIFPPFPIPFPPNPLFPGNPPHPAETSP